MCIKAGYREIAADLKKQILCGTYQSGDMLPSTRILASTYGVSLLTANKALNLLHEEGFLDRRHGSGTFLSGKIPKPPKYRVLSCGQSRYIAGAAMDYSMQKVFFEDIFQHLKSECEIREIPVNDNPAHAPINEEALAWADAVITLNGYMDQRMIETLKRCGKPVILRGCSWLVDCPFHQIVVDLRSGMEEVFRHLGDPAGKEFAVITNNYPDPLSRARHYLRELHNRGIPSSRIRFSALELPIGDSGRLCGYQLGLERSSELLGKVIFSTSDFLSCGLVEAFQKTGFRPGMDFELISFDNFEDASYAAFKEPTLTSIGYNIKDFSTAILELLHSSVRRQNHLIRHVFIPSFLRIRKTAFASRKV